MDVEMIFDAEGVIHSLYHECIPLQELGIMSVERASHIEFDTHAQCWEVLSPDKSRVLYSNSSRERCLKWERLNLSAA